MLLCVCINATIYLASSYYYTGVPILLYMYPHTTICVPSFPLTRVYMYAHTSACDGDTAGRDAAPDTLYVRDCLPSNPRLEHQNHHPSQR